MLSACIYAAMHTLVVTPGAAPRRDGTVSFSEWNPRLERMLKVCLRLLTVNCLVEFAAEHCSTVA
jgi:hypothetical protein